MYEDYRSQVMFFCGNDPDCIEFNSERALQKAMAVVDEHYSVVGILEDLNGTFQALENYVPRFFKNINSRFNKAKEEVKNKNYNPNKKRIPNTLRKTLEHKFSNDFEFYDFCKQRLHMQMKISQELSTKEIDVETAREISDTNQNRKFILL